MTRSRPDLGSVVLHAGTAGLLTLAPIALWVLVRTLPFNSLDLSGRWSLAGLLVLTYAGAGLLVGSGFGLLAHVLTRGRASGYLAGSLPLGLVVVGWVVAQRVRTPAPWLVTIVAVVAALAIGLGVARLARGRGAWAVGSMAVTQLALLAFLLMGGSPSGPSPRDPELLTRLAGLDAPEHPVLVLALDGVEAEILDALIARGELPNLRALRERGAHGRLQTLEPTWSPPIWTTIWTGKLPAEHGITYFVSRGTFRLGDATVVVPRLLAAQRIAAVVLPKVSVPVNQQQRRATAVWEALGLAGGSSVLANRILSWPALPIRGTEYSERMVREGDPGADAIYPPELGPEVRARLDAAPPVQDPGLDATPWLSATLGREAELWRCATERAVADSASLVVLYTHMIDSAQHRYLKYHWPRRFRFVPAADDVTRFGDVVAATHRAVDAMVGDAVAAMGSQARVLVISDHGVRANQALTQDTPEPAGLTRMPPAEDGQVSGVHGEAPDGIFVLAGPGIRPGRLEWTPHVLDIAPLLLDLLGLPGAADMQHASPLGRDPGLALPSGALPVTSYEGWIPRRPGALSTSSDPAILEELRALGYIE